MIFFFYTSNFKIQINVNLGCFATLNGPYLTFDRSYMVHITGQAVNTSILVIALDWFST